MAKHADHPDGFSERPADWHMEKLIEFTRMKGEIGEPSPHLAIMGHFCAGQEVHEKVWRLSCYAATYCLPTAHVMWEQVPLSMAMDKEQLLIWLTDNWKGVVTRQERRCVRTPANMAKCLHGCATWIHSEFDKLTSLQAKSDTDYYDQVWKSVTSIPFIGRYIAIRFIEGLRRYCGVDARLYDVRSIGGWSPKKCMAYLYPQHVDVLLTDTRESDQLADKIAREISDQFTAAGYPVDFYVLAAMLCEYKGAFENRHQYPGWTIDQEPLLYDKVAAYWGKDLAAEPLWKAREAIFPKEVLGEKSGWHGTRWDVAAVLRDFGYNWTDLKYDYVASAATGSLASPVERS